MWPVEKPKACQVRAQGSLKAAGSDWSSRPPIIAPDGMPRASAGSTMACGPSQPLEGNQPSHTPHTVASSEASRNLGRAARTAAPVPARACRSRRRDPRCRVRAQTSAATAIVTTSAPSISVKETANADVTWGRTGSPDTQDVPASPRGSPPSQCTRCANGPSSRLSCSRMAASCPGVGSWSAERARRTVSAGSVPDSQGSRATAVSSAVPAATRATPARHRTGRVSAPPDVTLTAATSHACRRRPGSARGGRGGRPRPPC